MKIVNDMKLSLAYVDHRIFGRFACLPKLYVWFSEHTGKLNRYWQGYLERA